MHYSNTEHIKSGDIYNKNNNCVKMVICNMSSINRKERDNIMSLFNQIPGLLFV